MRCLAQRRPLPPRRDLSARRHFCEIGVDASLVGEQEHEEMRSRLGVAATEACGKTKPSVCYWAGSGTVDRDTEGENGRLNVVGVDDRGYD